MYQKYRLSNGIRVVVEKIPYMKSVSLGIWVGAGSAHENLNNNGISHFIEHMLFKGTETRTAKEIAEAIDNIGGQLNAFTSKECTCYYAKVLDVHIHVAVDVLTDMLFRSTFLDAEIDKEKSVVLEEINMYEDSPEDNVHDLLSSTVFRKHPLGLPILGSCDTINRFDRELLTGYLNRNYTVDNIVISVVGNFNEKELIELLEEKFHYFANRSLKETETDLPAFSADSSTKYKDIEQVHLCIGLEGASLTSSYLYPLLIINNIFGGSMSSRLFQKIREDRGLAYSVYSYLSSYKALGLLTIYIAVNPSHVTEVLGLIHKEIKDLLKIGFTNDELEKSKEQLKGSYILGLESTSSRMVAIGKSELLTNHIEKPKEVLQKIDQVTMEEIDRIIHKVFDLQKASIAAVGKIDEKQNMLSILNNF